MTNVADVYAADTALNTGVRAVVTGTFSFSIEADADPDILSKVANQFNLANVPPSRASYARQAEGLAHIEVEMQGISATIADLIGRKLAQLSSVRWVEVSSAEISRA
jgi:hypothetical protein